MIDWRDLSDEDRANRRKVEDGLVTVGVAESLCAIADFARYDYATGNLRCVVGGMMVGFAGEMREMRTEWKRLDQWADDGGRV